MGKRLPGGVGDREGYREPLWGGRARVSLFHRVWAGKLMSSEVRAQGRKDAFRWLSECPQMGVRAVWWQQTSLLCPGFCRKTRYLCCSHASKKWEKEQVGALRRLDQCPRPLPGTRIIYDRKFLMETPPRDLPTIPGVTSPTGEEPPTEASQNHLRSSPEDKPAGGEWRLGKGMCAVPSGRGNSKVGYDGDCPTLHVGVGVGGRGCRTFIWTNFPRERGPGTLKAIWPHQRCLIKGAVSSPSRKSHGAFCQGVVHGSP
ncbi:Eukaryotic translation initiation factor 4E-binding protein 1 [Camelus dromedarius]|uniref:Eukaryotic translation initiation factor 4E-binding protein 1 n=1 Tax=Camelus dromedarius TaxID=9838 RepID=A0A5N4CFH4_CAMDR|nr:Eukaryotic translation initiation factor 4E-binding protein 1 [Camelus dromedarius]